MRKVIALVIATVATGATAAAFSVPVRAADQLWNDSSQTEDCNGIGVAVLFPIWTPSGGWQNEELCPGNGLVPSRPV